MKKGLKLLICLLLILGLCACGDKETSNDEKKQTQENSEKVENNENSGNNSSKSPKEKEKDAWSSSYYPAIKDYESEVFYTNDSIVKYDMLDNFSSESKNYAKKKITEQYETESGDISYIWVTLESLENWSYDKETKTEGALYYATFKRQWDLDYSEKHEASSIKKVNVGDYTVHYYYVKTYMADTYWTNLYMTFELNDKLLVSINCGYEPSIKFDSIKNNNIKDFEKLIKSFKVEVEG